MLSVLGQDIWTPPGPMLDVAELEVLVGLAFEFVAVADPLAAVTVWMAVDTDTGVEAEFGFVVAVGKE